MSERDSDSPSSRTADVANKRRNEQSVGSRYSTDRRHILKGLAVSAPVIMTVTGRPVLANVCSPSGYSSGNQSETVDCAVYLAYDPTHWAIDGLMWPYPYAKTDVFRDVFMLRGNKYPVIDMTLGEILGVLYPSPKAAEHFAQDAIAALLNAAALLTDYLSAEQVRGMVQDIYYSGQYEVQPGVYWDYQAVQAYFESTWT